MWFVSKKKYGALLKQKEEFERIAMNAVTQNGRLLTQMDEAIKEMKDIQELNHQLAKHNDVLLAYTQKLETELQEARQDNQKWAEDFEELDNAYGRLETDYDKLREELAHYEYEERFCHLEDDPPRYQEEKK